MSMLVINMSGSRNIQVGTIRTELYQLKKQHENRALILHEGLWYLYAENSVERLSDFNDDYKNFIYIAAIHAAYNILEDTIRR